MLDYFDAFLIGLTATPDKRTFGFFNQNSSANTPMKKPWPTGSTSATTSISSKPKITKKGADIWKANMSISAKSSPARSAGSSWTRMSPIPPKQLDEEVVNPNQIRTIIKTFKATSLPEIFPGRKEVPKTLIFAKTDSHADDIIQIVREEFGEGNAFCKKVTYKADEDPKSVLAQFRNDYHPRIAVTVDMIATGTDVKPLECLLFMRDVKSRNYFEQMKGRGTRTLDLDDLRKVTPSALYAKTISSSSMPLASRNPSKPTAAPWNASPPSPSRTCSRPWPWAPGMKTFFTTLAGRLGRLAKIMNEKEAGQFMEKAKGKAIAEVVKDLLHAFDPDRIESAARDQFNLEPLDKPTESQLAAARDKLISKATTPFTGDLNTFIENVRKVHEQIIDIINPDEVEFAGWDGQAQDQASRAVQDFKAYLEAHKDEIAALQIFYSQPHRRKDLTYAMIRELLERLKLDKPTLAPLRIWKAYERLDKVGGTNPVNELVALVSLLRRITGIDETLTPYDKTVDRNFQAWVFQKQAGPLKFTEEQMAWLRMMKEHIAASIHIEKDDLDLAPFDADGGLGRMWQLFGDKTDKMIDEINEALAA